eukprot:g25711.t1
MLNVMAKIVTAFYVFMLELSTLGNGGFCSELSIVLFIVYSLSFLVVLFFAVLGIRGTLKLPGGRQLAQFFLSRLVVEFSSLGNGEFFSELSMVLFILYSLSFLVVLFFAVLGIRGTLKLPGGRQLVQFFLRSIDERCFMLNVMAKIVTVFYFCLAELNEFGEKTMFSLLFTLYSLSFLVVLFFAVLGIHGTLKLPGGRQLAQFFLSRLVVSGNWRLSHRCWEQLEDATEQSSDLCQRLRMMSSNLEDRPAPVDRRGPGPHGCDYEVIGTRRSSWQLWSEVKLKLSRCRWGNYADTETASQGAVAELQASKLCDEAVHSEVVSSELWQDLAKVEGPASPSRHRHR